MQFQEYTFMITKTLLSLGIASLLVAGNAWADSEEVDGGHRAVCNGLPTNGQFSASIAVQFVRRGPRMTVRLPKTGGCACGAV